MFRAAILFAALLLTVATKDASHKSSSEVGTTMHAGPYSPIAAMIEDKTKRSSFYQLLRKMREIKNSDVKGSADAESKKNATRRALNGDMQKLLGDAVYQKYRAVRVANTAKAKTSTGGSASPKSADGVPSAAAAPASTSSASHAHAKKAKGKGKKVAASPAA